MLTSQHWQEDLTFLVDRLLAEQVTFSGHVAPGMIENAAQSLHEGIPTLAEHQIIVKMSGLLAMVGDGRLHFGLPFNSTIGFQQFPITLEMFPTGVFITGTAPLYQDMMCTQVLEIGHHPIEAVIDMVSPVCPRNKPSLEDVLVHITIPEVLHTFGIIDCLATAEFLVASDAVHQHWIEVESIPFRHGARLETDRQIGSQLMSLRQLVDDYSFSLPNSEITVIKSRRERRGASLMSISRLRYKRF
jgi:hypothetical protein